jgi:hypothetical protein
MKLYWTGTDSLMLVDYSMRRLSKKPYWFVFRLLVKVLEYFIQGHMCISDNIADNLRKFGVKKPIEITETKIRYTELMEKVKHDTFNVIYYRPKDTNDREFTDWLYGYDIINQVKHALPFLNFIELDGTADMVKVYPIADFLLRPNRHDGPSRMRLECEIQGILYYWTNNNPKVYIAINYLLKSYNEWNKY